MHVAYTGLWPILIATECVCVCVLLSAFSGGGGRICLSHGIAQMRSPVKMSPAPVFGWLAVDSARAGGPTTATHHPALPPTVHERDSGGGYNYG